MERKEVYATTGSRMGVRFFGGWDYDKHDVFRPDAVAIGYRKGVPMGGDLHESNGQAPKFLVWAMRDPRSAALQRVQIIKGWTEGLQLIKEGGKIQLFVPSELAYGDRGPLAHRTLIFDVELISIGDGKPASAAQGAQSQGKQ